MVPSNHELQQSPGVLTLPRLRFLVLKPKIVLLWWQCVDIGENKPKGFTLVEFLGGSSSLFLIFFVRSVLTRQDATHSVLFRPQ